MEDVADWNAADMSHLTEVIFRKVAVIQAKAFEEILTLTGH